jgi:hypothetical protein
LPALYLFGAGTVSAAVAPAAVSLALSFTTSAPVSLAASALVSDAAQTPVSGAAQALVVDAAQEPDQPRGVLGGADEAASTEAPMCDPMGASIAARPEIPEADRGRLEELPCAAQLWMAKWQLDAPDFGAVRAAFNDSIPGQPTHLQLPRSRYEGASAFGGVFPSRVVRPILLPRFYRQGLAPSAGHRHLPFRPPVARA